jgi:serine/threonine protein kinase, bacterial
MQHPLTEARTVNIDIESYLARHGDIFRSFPEQDSGCVSYGVAISGQHWFVKHSNDPRGLASLQRAWQLHNMVQHTALPRLYHCVHTPGGMALVYEWADGEGLYGYTPYRGAAGRDDPAGPHARFRALPAERILAAIDTIYDVHLLLADAGYVAVDLYDGCIIYDFERARTMLCDLDEYRQGPFVLEADRLPGSSRFMAPEEFQRGATIDQVTNVYTLGRVSAVFLGNGTVDPNQWRAGDSLRKVVQKATAPERGQRYPSVRAFVDAWRSAQLECVC